MEKNKLKLVLASASPRRKELLGHLQLPFEIKTLNVPEESSHRDPVDFSIHIAQLKGDAVYRELRNQTPQENLYVVSADTIVCLGKKIFGKPKGVEEARQMLSELSGQTHSVFTAVAVRCFAQGVEDSFAFAEESRVTFAPISDRLMENYLSTGDSLDKAGAYGIQGPSLTFISRVEGDYANVVGFPLSRFVNESEKFLKEKFPKVNVWQDLFLV